MKRANSLIGLIGLGIPLLWSGCTKPAEVENAVTQPPGTVGAASVQLRQLQLINRTASFVEYTYDTQGRQESVLSYSQRAGESKEDSPITLITYDQQNQLAKTEDGWFTLDSANHSVTKKLVIQWQEFTHRGSTTVVKTHLVDQTAYNGNPEITLELNAQQQIIKQVQRKADNATTETTFRYENENVAQSEQVSRDNSGAIKSRSRSSYVYDTSPNPLRGLLGPYGGLNVQSYASKNNVVKWTLQNLSADGTVVTSQTSTEYTYNYSPKGWPINYTTPTTSATFIYK